MTRSRRTDNLNRSALILSNNAYRKLTWFRDSKDTEVGAMGISSPEDPLFITDFQFIKQECTAVSTDFDEAAQTDWIEDHMEAGDHPDHFLRVWAHTHPGPSADPSSTDWDTFQEAMGNMPWGVMLILGTSNEFVCVFRVGDDMLNLDVEIEPRPIPKDWFDEIKNIEKPVVKGVGQRYTGYGHYTSDGYGYGTAKKKVKLDLSYWDDNAVRPSWEGFKTAMQQLPGKPAYTDLMEWNPGFEELVSAGPCRVINAAKQMYLNTCGTLDEDKVDHVLTSIAQALCGEAEEFNNYDTDIAVYWDPVALIHGLRDQQVDPEQLDTLSDDITKYVRYDKEKEDWFFTQKPSPSEDIFEMLTSPHHTDRETALSMMISTVTFFEDYIDDLDKGLQSSINDFFDQKAEYELCQMQNETNVS